MRSKTYTWGMRDALSVLDLLTSGFAVAWSNPTDALPFGSVMLASATIPDVYESVRERERIAVEGR